MNWNEISKEIWWKKSAKESNRFKKLLMQVLTQRCLQLLLTPKHFAQSNTSFWLLFKNKQTKQIFWSLSCQWKLLKTTDQFWHNRLKSLPNLLSRYFRGNGRKECSRNEILFSLVKKTDQKICVTYIQQTALHQTLEFEMIQRECPQGHWCKYGVTTMPFSGGPPIIHWFS